MATVPRRSAYRAPWVALLVLGASCHPPDAPSRPPARGADAVAPAGAPRVKAGPTPSASASPAPTAAPAPPGDALGTPHPVVLDAASPLGTWVVACQARDDTNGDGAAAVVIGPRGELEGDELRPYLMLGAGPGRAIDELVAADPQGRWLVIREASRLLLVDSVGGAEQALDAPDVDALADALPYADHRTVGFDGSGAHLLYVREVAARAVVVVRSLADGAERTVDPGPGKLWRAALDVTGSWVTVWMIVADTSGNGRLGWPVPERERLVHRCGGPIPRHAAWQDRGDTPVTLVAPASGGPARLVEGLVTPLKRRLLVRLPGGDLVVQSAKGKRTAFGDGRCLGHLVHADAQSELALFACEKPTGRPELTLMGPGYEQALGVEVPGQATFAWPTSTPRLVPVYPGQDALLVDFAKRTTRTLKPRDGVILVAAQRALVRRDASLVVVDADLDTEHELLTLSDPLFDVVTAGAVAVVSPYVVDLGADRVLGTVRERPLAVTTDGHVLVATGRDADAEGLAVGPLRWVAARAPDPPPP